MLPRLFRRHRLLIIGCGDTGQAIAQQWAHKARIFALTSSKEKRPLLRQLGIIPILGDLDKKFSLNRINGLANDVLMLAPPPNTGVLDTRTRHLIQALRRGRPCQRRIVYASTTGVYGDQQGKVVTETSPLQAQQDRSKRRINAERQWRAVATQHATNYLPIWHCRLLRISGIYHAKQLPLERIRAGTPVLTPNDDVYTNHIALSDLAHICMKTLFNGSAQRSYNVSDGTPVKHSEYIRDVAEWFGLPAPRSCSKEALPSLLTPMQWSFLSESRQVSNQRLMQEIKPMITLSHHLVALEAWAPKVAI